MQNLPIRAVAAVDGYGPVLAKWIWMFEDTRARTRAVLEGLAPAAVDWTGDGGRNSIGALLYHIAAIEADWIFSDVLRQPFPPEVDALLPYSVRDDAGVLSGVRGEDLAQHLKRLDTIRHAVLAALRNLPDQELDHPRGVGDQHVTPEWVLHHLMQHEAEHRGQIGEIRILAERGSTPA